MAWIVIQHEVQPEAWGPQAGEQAGCMFPMMVMGLRVLDRTLYVGEFTARLRNNLGWFRDAVWPHFAVTLQPRALAKLKDSYLNSYENAQVHPKAKQCCVCLHYEIIIWLVCKILTRLTPPHSVPIKFCSTIPFFQIHIYISCIRTLYTKSLSVSTSLGP